MRTMTSALEWTEREFAARPATVERGASLSWAEHVARVRKAAGALAGLGLKPGDTFAVIAANSPAYTELLHAGYWSRIVPVPINHRLAPPEVQQILDDAGCKLLIRDAIYKSPLDVATIMLDEFAARLAAAEPAAPRGAHPDDLALLLFTGGTTGRSKGVRLSHGNLVANGHQVGEAMRARSEDRYLHVAPMFHAADLLATPFTLVGGSHAYLPAFSGAGVLQAIQDHRVTVTMLAPTMIILTLQEPRFAGYDLKSFRLLFYGSSPMDAVWVERAMTAFAPAEIQQGYGLTETSPILTTLDPADHVRALAENRPELLRAAGRAVSGVEIRIVDDDGRDVPPGQVGEVAARGPNVTAGYLNRPEETAQAIRGGWFHTGDMGRLDTDGILYLVDRKKDVVITGGENVYTTEVEAALYTHPAVQEAAVIGVPNATYGEALLAVVVPVGGKELTAEALIEHCRGRIGGYKIPRRIELVREMPKSAMGKILKTELRRIYGGK